MKKIDDGKHGNDENYGKATPSHDSHSSHNSQSLILPPRGDYQTLLSYQKSEVVYQITFRFCQRFLRKGDRTIDQMVQAARSGKQNIVEGSKAATTSKEMEIKLTNVARASLEELLEDYRDFLKVRDLPIWAKDSKEALYVRKLGQTSPASYKSYRTFVDIPERRLFALSFLSGVPDPQHVDNFIHDLVAHLVLPDQNPPDLARLELEQLLSDVRIGQQACRSLGQGLYR